MGSESINGNDICKCGHPRYKHKAFFGCVDCSYYIDSSCRHLFEQRNKNDSLNLKWDCEKKEWVEKFK